MNQHRRSFAASVALTLAFIPVSLAQDVAGQRVFRAARAGAAVPANLWERGVRRVVPVSADPSLFSRETAKRISTGRLRTELNLFADTSLSVSWTSEGLTDDFKSLVWTGNVDGFPLGHAVLISSGDMLTANISTGDGRVFQIRTLEDGSQFVREVDTLQLLPEGPTVPAPDSATPASAADDSSLAAGRNASNPAADDGSIIDVLVIYTPSATAKAGGANAIQQQVQLAVAETNQGYSNSGVIQRIRLVNQQEVQYSETGDSSQDLARLVSPNDGYLDVAQRLRELYSADLVSLWVGRLSDSCGQAADILRPASPKPDLGYNVVDYTCATTNLSFAHELGHLMGAAHDRAHTSVNSGAYAYSYGYAQIGVQRTIMAYPDPCNCPRLNFWSNPGLRYGGYPLGIDETLSTGTSNSHTLNNTRAIIANYRTAQTQGGNNNGLPESDHPYANNLDKTYTYTMSGNPSAVNVTFDSRTSVENGYDFIHVTDSAGAEITGSPYTGTTLANRTVTVRGATVKIRLVSDGALSDYGFRVTAVTATGGATSLPKIVVTGLTAPATGSLGVNLASVRVTLANQGTAAAGAFRVGFYYSQDRTITTADPFSGFFCKWDSLAVNTSSSCSGEIGVPTTLGPGVWYFAAVADDLNQLQQSDRSSNIRLADSGAITIGGGVAAELQRPTPNSLLTASSATFQWTTGSGITGYSLAIGTRAGGTDVFNRDLGTAVSVTVSNLPTNGATLYVTLTSRIGATPQTRTYTLLAATIQQGNPQPKLVISSFSAATSANVGDKLTDLSLTVSNTGASARSFRVGFYYSRNSAVTSRDVFSGWYCNFGEGLGAGQSSGCDGDIGVPTTLGPGQWYVAAIADDLNQLAQTDTSGGTRVNDNGQVTISGAAPASIISPANGVTLSSSSQVFRWDAGSGGEEYWLSAGNAVGGSELYNQSQGLSLTAQVTGLPTNGQGLFVRLFTRFGSDWYSNDYSYRAFNLGAGSTPKIVITSFTAPTSGAAGSTLQGMRVAASNQSSSNAGPFRLGFYYSQRTPVTTSDVYSGWYCDVKDGLAAGTNYSCEGDIGIPASLTAGRWYLAAIADDSSKLTQADRSGSTRVADSGILTISSAASGGTLPESAHPYANNDNRIWTYTATGSPAAIKVTFSASTSVEDGYDFIYIYDSTGAQIRNSPFTGDSLAGAFVIVPGATVRIRLESDDSVTDYGFKVASVASAGALPKLAVTAFTVPTRGTIGVNLQNMAVTVVNQGNAAAPPFHVGFFYGRKQAVSINDVDSGWSCDVKAGLAVGATYRCGGEIGVPNSLAPGGWYVAAIADSEVEIDQSDRRSNSRSNDAGVTTFSAGTGDSPAFEPPATTGAPLSGVATERHPVPTGWSRPVRTTRDRATSLDPAAAREVVNRPVRAQ